MKIVKADVYTLDLPVNADVKSIVVGALDGGKAYLDIVIKLVTDTGTVGFGEVNEIHPMPGFSITAYYWLGS